MCRLDYDTCMYLLFVRQVGFAVLCLEHFKMMVSDNKKAIINIAKYTQIVCLR